MEITLNIPTKHHEAIKSAFGISTPAEYKAKLIAYTRRIVRVHEHKEALKNVSDSVTIPDDLVE